MGSHVPHLDQVLQANSVDVLMYICVKLVAENELFLADAGQKLPRHWCIREYVLHGR